MHDPYYNPEEFDAEIVGEISWSQPCWDFDLTVVWKGSDGFYRMDSDSGCSCPSPFEDTRYEELERISAHEVAAALNARLDEMRQSNYGAGEVPYVEPQVVELISRLMA